MIRHRDPRTPAQPNSDDDGHCLREQRKESARALNQHQIDHRSAFNEALNQIDRQTLGAAPPKIGQKVSDVTRQAKDPTKRPPESCPKAKTGYKRRQPLSNA